jgi:nanoRNase/pAp phosphatase (c-di-AMP/oligoRNAs hydrolase)
MSLSPQEQLQNFLEKSQEVLILIPKNPSADAIGSAWGIYWFLKKQNTSATVAFSHPLPTKFNFLPQPKEQLNKISGARDFILSFDTTRNKIMQVRQEEKENRFNILVTPEKGAIDPQDFSFVLAKFKYDLLIVIDSPDLENLGSLYTQNTDLFFEVPIVNIDSHSNNDNFGQINLVDVTASSSAEIITHFLENSAPKQIDQKIATCLLTGLIGATDSFQKKNTTPKALATSAILMDYQANQQEIIRWLYKTQPLHILKLWGRAMAKINWDFSSRLVWSSLSVEDFVQSRAKNSDLPLVLEKLAENYSDGRIFVLLYNETPKTVTALIKTTTLEERNKINSQLESRMQRELIEVKFNQSDLIEAGKILAQKLKTVVATK